VLVRRLDATYTRLRCEPSVDVRQFLPYRAYVAIGLRARLLFKLPIELFHPCSLFGDGKNVAMGLGALEFFRLRVLLG
jgi:hypothetical protein